jgi:glycosyltransferase involved in cell wall biosynthesis
LKISVVIPLYNKEKTIGRAINSVLNQSHSNLELIVIDDGSEDFGAEVVEKFNDPRIKLYRQSNKGVSAARNLGVEKANSDWVAFLDADDEYEPVFLSRCVEMLIKFNHHKISFVASDYAKRNTFKKKPKKTSINAVESGETNYFNLCKGNKSPGCASSSLVNRTAFFIVGGFPMGIEYFEDWILWMKLAWHGKFIYINEKLSNYWMNETSVSSNKNFNIEKLYPCAKVLIDTAQKSSISFKKKKELLWSTMVYVNFFILHQSYNLLRRGKYKQSAQLLIKLRLKYLRFAMIQKLIRIFSFAVYSAIYPKAIAKKHKQINLSDTQIGYTCAYEARREQ